jgi:hypothetical protein
LSAANPARFSSCVCLAAKLPPSNVHSAEGWEESLLPEIERQQRFYNKRETAEQWIKEGKQPVAMTRLSVTALTPTRCGCG